MKLPDFSAFRPFDDVRRDMKAELVDDLAPVKMRKLMLLPDAPLLPLPSSVAITLLPVPIISSPVAVQEPFEEIESTPMLEAIIPEWEEEAIAPEMDTAMVEEARPEPEVFVEPEPDLIFERPKKVYRTPQGRIRQAVSATEKRKRGARQRRVHSTNELDSRRRIMAMGIIIASIAFFALTSKEVVKPKVTLAGSGGVVESKKEAVVPSLPPPPKTEVKTEIPKVETQLQKPAMPLLPPKQEIKALPSVPVSPENAEAAVSPKADLPLAAPALEGQVSNNAEGVEGDNDLEEAPKASNLLALAPPAPKVVRQGKRRDKGGEENTGPVAHRVTVRIYQHWESR